MQNLGRMAVLIGGFSGEHEISLDSGATILTALKSKGVGAHTFDPKEAPLSGLKTRSFQTAFSILYGIFGGDGAIRDTLELTGISYTSSGVAASALGMDKYRYKLIQQAVGLPVPEFVVLHDDSDFDAAEGKLGLPMLAKPATESSSIGVMKVKEKSRLKSIYEELKHLRGEIITEHFIGGGEYSCPILNGKDLPSIYIIPATEFYDYEAKYNRDDTVYQCPSENLSEAEENLTRGLVVYGTQAIGAGGCPRVDFLKNTDGKLYPLEINTLPDMTSHSLVPKSAVHTGVDFANLCIEILKAAHVR